MVESPCRTYVSHSLHIAANESAVNIKRAKSTAKHSGKRDLRGGTFSICRETGVRVDEESLSERCDFTQVSQRHLKTFIHK